MSARPSAGWLLGAAGLPVAPFPLGDPAASPERIAQAFETDSGQPRAAMRDPDNTVLFMLADEVTAGPDLERHLARIRAAAAGASVLCLLVRCTQGEPRGKVDIISQDSRVILIRIVVHSALAADTGFADPADTANVVALLKRIRRT